MQNHSPIFSANKSQVKHEQATKYRETKLNKKERDLSQHRLQVSFNFTN